MSKITKRLVEAAEVRDKDYIIFDSEIPGFGARILPNGKRSYLVQYRVGRKFRRMSLGLHGRPHHREGQGRSDQGSWSIPTNHCRGATRHRGRNRPGFGSIGEGLPGD